MTDRHAEELHAHISIYILFMFCLIDNITTSMNMLHAIIVIIAIIIIFCKLQLF